MLTARLRARPLPYLQVSQGRGLKRLCLPGSRPLDIDLGPGVLPDRPVISGLSRFRIYWDRRTDMSTRAMVDFVDSYDKKESLKRDPDLKIPEDRNFYSDKDRIYRVSSRIYRHCDGYPEGLGVDLIKFFQEVEKQTTDRRFSDSEYLPAKFIVWQAGQYTAEDARYEKKEKAPLDFIGIGIGMEYHGDLEYVYRVDCSNLDGNGRPTITVAKYQEGKLEFKPLPKKALNALVASAGEGVKI